MAIYDVTVTLRADMPTFDGEPGPERRLIKEIGRQGQLANVSALSLGVHSGTHVDAPVHFWPRGIGVDELPLDAMLGDCRVVDLASQARIEASDLESAVPPETERLLLKTRNSELWDDRAFRTDFVGLSAEAARPVAARGVRLLGIDYLSIEPYHADPPAAHLTLLRAGVVVVEGLDLRRVPPGEYELTCLPIKLAGSDGAPARVVLRSRP